MATIDIKTPVRELDTIMPLPATMQILPAALDETPPAKNSASTFQVETPNVKPRSRFRIVMILTSLYLSLFIAALDATIIATAVPIITAELHSAAGYIWIGGAYLITNAAFAPIWVKFSDIWGRKPIFLTANVLFAASSVICATAVDIQMLIAGRAMQGAAGGGLICLTNVAISDLFSVRERSLYLGFCEGIWAVSGAIGPLLGGAFAQKVSWRWCFYINLPVAGCAFVLSVLFLDVHNPRTPMLDGIKAVDWFGCVSILGVTVMLLLGLQLGGSVAPWSSAKVICLIILGSLMILFFIYSEKKLARYPVLPLSLFDKMNMGILLVTFSHGMVFIAAEYYLPLYFQAVKEASPLKSGVLLVPLIVATAVVGVLSGVFIHRTGQYRPLIWIGIVFLTLGSGLFIMMGPETPIGTIVAFEIIGGIGSGMLFEPPLIAIQQTVDQNDVGTATSTQSFIRSLGISLGVIVGGIVFQQSMDLRKDFLREAGLTDNSLESFSGKNAGANVHLAPTLPTAQAAAVKQAFSWSIRNMFIMLTVLGFLGVLSSALVPKRKLSKEYRETVTGLIKEQPVPDATVV